MRTIGGGRDENARGDRQSGGEGKRGELGGCRLIKKKKKRPSKYTTIIPKSYTLDTAIAANSFSSVASSVKSLKDKDLLHDKNKQHSACTSLRNTSR